MTIPAWNPAARECPSRSLFTKVGDRWNMLIILALENGPLRNRDLQAAVDGISDRVLSQRLSALTADGLVARTAFPEIPRAWSTTSPTWADQHFPRYTPCSTGPCRAWTPSSPTARTTKALDRTSAPSSTVPPPPCHRTALSVIEECRSDPPERHSSMTLDTLR